MKQLENNAYFWQKLDSLYFSSSVVIERPKHSKHPRYDDMVYPVDYGYLTDTISSDGSQIDVFFGSDVNKKIKSIAVSTDIIKRDCEIKLLIGCTDQEELDVLHMLNVSENQKAILVRRSNESSSWSQED
ncbi:MAG: Inorganic pyrophosphatase [Erysipelotrichales bacterium]|nr:Inorganic pyrophosphatase [Erysipelotrichales bacterium]